MYFFMTRFSIEKDGTIFYLALLPAYCLWSSGGHTWRLHQCPSAGAGAACQCEAWSDETAAEKKKKKVFILQHPQEARCLPHCGAVKWTWCPGGLKTLHKVIKVLVSAHSVDDPAVEVPSCGWSSWQPSFNNLVKYTSVFWWPGEKSCNTTQVWEEKLMLAWWSSGGVALLAVERPWCVCHRRMLSRAAHR